jgi:hypothetical protein
MTGLRPPQPSFRVLVFATSIVTCCSAFGQQMSSDLEARVSGLPLLMAKSHDLADVLPTSLDTILHDRSICCGRDSALEDSVARADPLSLKDVASRLEGRHLLGDGRPISVKAEFWPTEAVDGLRIVNTLNDKRALMMVWNSRLYVTEWFTDGSVIALTAGHIAYSGGCCCWIHATQIHGARSSTTAIPTTRRRYKDSYW